jgi:D-alanyl-lipoteichoic acid acyltransferase DltB (MBOAT superfamily)
MSNFKFPYFSRNIGEFWRRWHISLSTWFRDYLYIPLGGSQEGKWKSIRNIFIIFLVSGFWHGANWSFIFWGLFHSILFLPTFMFNKNRNYTSSIIAANTLLPSLKEFISVGTTFLLVTIGWVFFRSESIGDSFSYLTSMISNINIVTHLSPKINFYILVLVLVDWTQRFDERNLFVTFPKLIFKIFVIICVFLILINFKKESQQFIYFDF